MNDRYLYRAKRTDNGEWVEGDLVHSVYKINDTCVGKYGSEVGIHQVHENTICQCTGLKDKNRKLIWESDVVEFEDVGEEGYEYKEGFDFINRAKVEFAEARWSLTDFISTNSSVVDEMYNHVEFMDFWNNCEVIGNVFDNPELLEVGEC